MRQTWRWFGPVDPVGVDDMLQAGVEGVVTALHHVPPGVALTDEAIARRQAEVATRGDGSASGLAWEVIESLPVSEAIKTQGPDCAAHLAAWRASLEALARAGIGTVCYNFMPVLDWTRTVLRCPMPHGGTAMAFDLIDFAAFDLHLLARPGAADDYGAALRAEAERRVAGLDDVGRAALARACLSGLPGEAEAMTVDRLRGLLHGYAGIDDARLRGHLADFLAEVVPTAERLGLRLCCHPDDPPFPLLGLPRIVSDQGDYRRLVEAVPSPANGITFCTGSLGVRHDFDPVAFLAELGPHVHFAHLRTTTRDGAADGARVSFHEALHLEGDVDLAATVRALMAEEARRRAEGRADAEIPMRADHGQELLSDVGAGGTPGYPLVGRMRGLAELRGLMAASNAPGA